MIRILPSSDGKSLQYDTLITTSKLATLVIK
jgi:hypothetical protein